MSQVIKAIIFDLGNVLIDFDHRSAAGKIAGRCRKTAEEVFDLFFFSGLTILFEEGKIPPEEFFLRVKDTLVLDMNYAEFMVIWNGIFFLSPKNRAVMSLVNSLSPCYPLAVLSNINMAHYRYLREKFPIFSPFKNVFTSFELGAVKPSPVIYKKALDALGVSGAEVFYTDDRQDLIEAGNSLGMNSFIFTTAAQLKNDLLSQGIVVDEDDEFSGN